VKTTDETIEELLKLAHVSESQIEQARAYLKALVTPGPTGKSPARSVYDAGSKRGTAAPHNEKVRAVEAAADKLQKALINLRSKPYAHADFWYFEAFGPIYVDEIERPQVLATIEVIRRAAIEARMHTTNRRKSEQYNLARLAVRFFKKFTSATTNKELYRFVEAFFEAVTEKVGDYENEELTRAIQAGLKETSRQKAGTNFAK
jgi:hypothetical protein